MNQIAQFNTFSSTRAWRKPLFAGLMLSLALAFLHDDACAQSSVTLYGIIDNGLSYSSNQGGHARYFIQDGIQRGDRLGFLGSEDLGGGQKAIFRLENGYTASTGALGQGGLMFGRQAYVGLASKQWGQLTLGRQYDFQTDLLAYIPCSECGVYSVANDDIDRVAGERLNNTVRYENTSLTGFRFGAMYSFSSGSAAPSNASAGAAYSLLAEYKRGEFGIASALTSIRDVSISPAAIGLTSIFGRSLATNPAFLMNRQRIVGIGTSYAPGNFKFTGTYSNTQLQFNGSQGTDQIVRAGIQYRLHSSLLLLAALSKSWFQGSQWSQLSFGTDYFLTKRTDVYLDGELQHASGVHAQPFVYLTGASTSDNQLLLRIGMRHTF